MRSHNKADWVVKVDKNEFYMTEAEYQTLKKAAGAGRTMVWFDDITISIPHVSYMERIKRTVYREPAKLPEAGIANLHAKIVESKKKHLNR